MIVTRKTMLKLRKQVNGNDSTNAAINCIFRKKGNEQKFRLWRCQLNLKKKTVLLNSAPIKLPENRFGGVQILNVCRK